MKTTLEVQKRSTKPHSNRRKIRENGLVPAVVYGHHKHPVPITLDTVELIKSIRENGLNHVFEVTVDNEPLHVLLQDYQKDPIKGDLIHIDLLAVNMKEEVETDVRIELVGTAKGAKAGGVLQHVLHEVVIKVTPDKLPETIKVDISEMEIGDTRFVSDLPKNPDYEVKTEPEKVIVTIMAPRVQEDLEAANEEKASAEESDEQ